MSTISGVGTGTCRYLSLQHITRVVSQLQGGIQREGATRVMHYSGGRVTGAGCVRGTEERLVAAEGLGLGPDQILDIQLALQIGQETSRSIRCATISPAGARGHRRGVRTPERWSGENPVQHRGREAPHRIRTPRRRAGNFLIGQVHSQCQPATQQLQGLQVPRQVSQGTAIAREAGAVATPRATVQLLAMHAMRQ